MKFEQLNVKYQNALLKSVESAFENIDENDLNHIEKNFKLYSKYLVKSLGEYMIKNDLVECTRSLAMIIHAEIIFVHEENWLKNTKDVEKYIVYDKTKLRTKFKTFLIS